MRSQTKAPGRGSGTGAQGETGQHERAKAKPGRKELQGILTDRNSCQRAPTWPDAPGSDAANLLCLLLRGWSR
jgi:hypothetical protein